LGSSLSGPDPAACTFAFDHETIGKLPILLASLGAIGFIVALINKAGEGMILSSMLIYLGRSDLALWARMSVCVGRALMR
jgi:hypothetical protein